MSARWGIDLLGYLCIIKCQKKSIINKEKTNYFDNVKIGY